MASPFLISRLIFPTVVDVSTSSSWELFAISVTPGSLGPGAHASIGFDYITFGFDIGETGEFLNSFNDDTPNYASSTYEFFGGYPAGEYSVSSLLLWDDAGNFARYSAADLKAMGLPSSFTVIDRAAPAAPTIQVDNAGNVPVQDSHAHFSGTAGAFQDIDVTYFDGSFTLSIGKTTADAQGHWSLTSKELHDGHYTQVVATATQPSDGRVSTHSTPVDFYVQKPPEAPMIQVASGSDGAINAAKPLFWGNTIDHAKVSLYEGDKLITTVQSGDYGWWGILPGQLASGAHHLNVIVEDQFGRKSPASVIDVKVAAPAAGISFNVGSLDNQTMQALDVNKLQLVLDAVSALVSGALDGAQNIALTVVVKTLPDDRVIASAGSIFHKAVDGAMPMITDARLNLSPEFAKQLNDADFLTSDNVAVLTHEMLHVLGFQSDPASEFQKLTGKVGDDVFFYGAHSHAINGALVELAPDQAHLADELDVIAPVFQHYLPYFMNGDQAAPFSPTDLAILTDLGYQNKDVIVSYDGHRYLPGDGKAGHDTVTGMEGRDTLYIDGKSSGYAVKATATGYSAADIAGVDGTLQLSNIERIYFSDKAMALDVGVDQIGGMAYRMYQAAFNRAPDSAGLGFWIDKMDRGLSLGSLAHAFASSDEFVKLYGTKQNDTAYITQLYANVLHRSPEEAGLAFWQSALQAGHTRENVLAQFSESTENIAQLVGTLHDGFTYAYYRG